MLTAPPFIETRWFSESQAKVLPPVCVVLPLASWLSERIRSSGL
jgi:hypothetical protein